MTDTEICLTIALVVVGSLSLGGMLWFYNFFKKIGRPFRL